MNSDNMKALEQPARQKLAIAIVPFQPENSAMYDAADSLAQGTLFPALNLPFRLAINGSPVPVTPLTEVQALDFVLVELNLYLDTHPDDREAFLLYRKYAVLAEKCRKIYEEKYGPLNKDSAAMQDHYRWIHGPWPWEKEAN